ncbi:MAG: alpha/beta hydrolase [Verrucomicrobia bacterium]|nr:alpha/beta hydrolase [Cytophagales bacterium]
MKKLKKRYILLVGLSLLFAGYAFGPMPDKPQLNTNLPEVSKDFAQLEQNITAQEKIHPSLKPDNQARIIWADTLKRKTKYALVYIHGYSASQGEGEPLHRNFAKRYGCNLFLPRMADHGLDTTDNFINLTPERLLAHAKQAISIGKQLGDSVIVMGTSNGGAMALYLATEHPELKGLILYSPLIEFFDKSSVVLDKPWGLQIARQVTGGENRVWEKSTPDEKKYWTTKYRLEGLIYLKSMISQFSDEKNFKKVKSPLFLGYYFKDEENQDKTVSVPAMLEMFDQVGTLATMKRKVNFPEASNHVICSQYTSKEWQKVQQETFKFAEEILKLKPVE